MMSTIKKLLGNSYSAFLLALIFFHIILNIVFHTLNKAPPTWDSAGHLGLSMLFADKLPGLLTGQTTITDFIKISNYYPPLVQFLGGIFILLLGRTYYSAIFIGTIFLVIAIVYLYKTVNRLFSNQKLALLTVIIFSFFPHVWEQSRHFHLDVPLVALLLASFYHLTLSDSLKNRRHSILFFVFFGLAQLTKWYGFVYLIIPFIYEVWFKVKEVRDYTNTSRIQNILIGSLIFIIFVIPWYVLNFENIQSVASITSTGEVGDPVDVLSVESFVHYLRLITAHQITFVSVILVFAALYGFHRQKVKFRNYLYLLILVPYLTFSLIQNKDLRYVLPLTPAFALAISYFFTGFNSKLVSWIKYAFLGFLVFVFFFMTFNRFTLLPDKYKFVAYAIGGPYYHGWYYEPYFYAYNSEDWQNNEIVSRINLMAAADKNIFGKYRVLVLTDNKYYSLASLELFRRQNEFNQMEITVPYFQFTPFTPEELKEHLSKINYAIVPGNPGPPGLRNVAVLNQLINYFNSQGNTDFSRSEEFLMPDGNVLTVYKRVNYAQFAKPNIREDSLKIRIGNILFLDREKIGGTQFGVTLFDKNGSQKYIDVTGGSGQKRISLEGVEKFRIDLPVEQQDFKEMRGWRFDNGVYMRDPLYDFSNNTYFYSNLDIVQKQNFSSLDQPYTNVVLEDDYVKISQTGTGERVFVAYATTGWVWNNVWLGDDNRQVSVPVEGLVQLEISSQKQEISNFDDRWGFFSCYEGKAVCYYPIVPGL